MEKFAEDKKSLRDTLGNLRVRMFGVELPINGHVDVQTKRNSVISLATIDYEAWVQRNTNRIVIEDIITENHTTVAGPHDGWLPLACCVITVKYYGNSVL